MTSAPGTRQPSGKRRWLGWGVREGWARCRFPLCCGTCVPHVWALLHPQAAEACQALSRGTKEAWGTDHGHQLGVSQSHAPSFLQLDLKSHPLLAQKTPTETGRGQVAGHRASMTKLWLCHSIPTGRDDMASQTWPLPHAKVQQLAPRAPRLSGSTPHTSRLQVSGTQRLPPGDRFYQRDRCRLAGPWTEGAQVPE